MIGKGERKQKHKLERRMVREGERKQKPQLEKAHDWQIENNIY